MAPNLQCSGAIWGGGAQEAESVAPCAKAPKSHQSNVNLVPTPHQRIKTENADLLTGKKRRTAKKPFKKQYQDQKNMRVICRESYDISAMRAH